MTNNPTPSICLLCNTRLVKNGRNSAGNQRWKCPSCGASSLRKRPDRTQHFRLDTFVKWLLGKSSQAEITGTLTGRSFRRHHAWCWQIIPRLPAVESAPKHVIIDGTYIGTWCLLVATDERQTPLAWQWCATESQAAWEALLKQIPAPHTVTCDGGQGVRAAIRETWPGTLTQRCIFHVWMNMKSYLTLRPRTPAGQALLRIARNLKTINTTDQAVKWLQDLNDWYALYGHLTTERSYAKQRFSNGLWDSPTGKRWWYTHDNLRKAYNLLTELQRRGHLFTYLTTGCPKTTSRLEGGINSIIKNVLRLHRGMSEEHQRRAAEWVLIDRAGLLNVVHSLNINEHVAPVPRPRPRFTEPAPGPALYDTGLDANEGLWSRSGWAGRG